MFKTRILRRNVWNSSLGSAKSHTHTYSHTHAHTSNISLAYNRGARIVSLYLNGTGSSSPPHSHPDPPPPPLCSRNFNYPPPPPVHNTSAAINRDLEEYHTCSGFYYGCVVDVKQLVVGWLRIYPEIQLLRALCDEACVLNSHMYLVKLSPGQELWCLHTHTSTFSHCHLYEPREGRNSTASPSSASPSSQFLLCLSAVVQRRTEKKRERGGGEDEAVRALRALSSPPPTPPSTATITTNPRPLTVKTIFLPSDSGTKHT